MSLLSQFYSGASNDNIELELWVVGGGGGGGGKTNSGNAIAGGGGGGGIYYNHVTVPRGSSVIIAVGGGGAGGAYDSGTDIVYSGYQGSRTIIRIRKGDLFAKTYSVVGGGGGGGGAYASTIGGDGGCGGGSGIGYGTPSVIDSGITYNDYKNGYFYKPGSSTTGRYAGRSYYTLKDSFLSNPYGTAYQSYAQQPNLLNNGYYGADAPDPSQGPSGTGGGVFMPIPGLLNVSTPGYYSADALWKYDYDPHNDIPIVSIPGSANLYNSFSGYANTGNGGRGGNTAGESGTGGSSGFVFFRYPFTFGSVSTTDSDVIDVSFSNRYNNSSGYRAYIVTGAAELTLPTI